MIQIKDVPDDVHRALKARAAREGITLTEIARRTLEHAARHPSRAELVAELSTIEPVDTGGVAAADSLHVARALRSGRPLLTSDLRLARAAGAIGIQARVP